MIMHCFFEQSGTFKNEFKKLGFQAFDYDILNDFGQTDYIIDLFDEISKAYDNKKSIFDNIDKNDLIFAFFPCVRFEAQILMSFRGDSSGFKNWTSIQKLEKDLELHKELHEMYTLITKLALVCLKREIMLIIENPYSSQHYLQRYWCLKPKIIDMDRRWGGDYYEKPTQYWFINCEPRHNFIFEPQVRYKTRKIDHASKVERSMISKEYANRFIREFVIESTGG